MDVATRREVLRVGIGGPVGSGKTALVDSLCKRLRDRLDIAVVTNDIYTREDAEFLIRSEALPAERIRGVETGGCPHTAIREDASINLEAVSRLSLRPGEHLPMILEPRVQTAHSTVQKNEDRAVTESCPFHHG